MKCKAVKNFVGKVNMVVGEVREIENEIATDLIRAGYVVNLEEKKKKAEEIKESKGKRYV